MNGKTWRVRVTIFFLSFFTSNAFSVSTTSSWREWPKAGSAELSVLFFDVYSSELYTPDGDYIVEDDITPHPLALSITYKRDISKAALVEATVEQWNKLGYDQTLIPGWEEIVTNIFPGVSEGHNLTYVTNGVKGSFFYSPAENEQSRLIGTIEDEKLNDAFLAIWLSPKTEYPKLRKGLIGDRK
ncbi:chalcone isomerase family protein [Vibrio caribbeanicus]|uniref:Chalcone isomerase domain-containing protein n=1 Tax=Vibrio caribbeanicus ATCC BAA-2122 TaxID=796620 RepID=E3BEH2_9VIBR|nr:chalcone isomerase family protein [Vibrio caribbeanicus]EFP98589.1 hypothetical protein VIBC2010_08578 [Vibrio caribbeanicus ATCC BAA-2122]